MFYVVLWMFYDILKGAVWICMEVMDTSLEKFYRAVFSKSATIPESFLGVVAVSVSSFSICLA